METLVIVDFQKDFADKNGALYVPNANYAKDAIVKYIGKFHDEISDIVFTVDWHSTKHCSFIRNGGEWPTHCVQYSEGAGIPDELIEACIFWDIPYKVFEKGTTDDKEEYGAFENIGTYFDSNDQPFIVGFNIDHQSQVSMDTNNIVVCGLAGDYCVQETIKNLMKYKGDVELNISTLKDGVASIDGGESFNKFITENNITMV